jgi:hypothetical protein
VASEEGAYPSNGSATAGVSQDNFARLGTRSPDAGDYAGSWTGAVPAGRSNDISHLRSESLHPTDEEVILQIYFTGPGGITFINPADDPRKKAQ